MGTLAYHRHQIVDRLRSLGICEKVHYQVAQIVAVVGGDELHALLQVLPLDGDEAVAGERQHDLAQAHQVLLRQKIF